MNKNDTPKFTPFPAPPAYSEEELGNPYLTNIKMRDYFAAKTIGGMCSSGLMIEWSNRVMAAKAYAIADAMLEASKQ